jgi:putative ABC transport system permease protein
MSCSGRIDIFRAVFDILRQDLTIALRSLVKNRVYSAVAVLTLAVGIGAAVTVFAAMDGVLLRRLPIEHEDRLVLVRKEQPKDGTLVPFGYADLRALRQKTRLVEDVAGVQYDGAFPWVVVDGGLTTTFMGTLVSGEFFRVLGARPALGRLLEAGDALTGAEPVVIISYRLWQARFGGDPRVLGRRLQINGEMSTVVGVAPRGFVYPAGVELWLPTMPLIASDGSELQPFSLLMRLRPGVSVSQARAMVSNFVREREVLAPAGDPGGRRASLVPIREAIIGSVRQPIIALSFAVALVLTIAVVNVAGLVLVRGVERQRELAIRSALGAGRKRLLSQLLVENAVLATAGVAVGLPLGYAGVRGLLLIAPPGLPRLDNIALSAAVFGFAATVALLVTIALGAVSGVAVTRVQVASSFLRSIAPGAPLRHGVGGKEYLVALQIALALLVAVAAGLLTRSLARMQRVDLGLEAVGLSVVQLDLPWDDTTSSEQYHLVLKQLTDRLATGEGLSDATPALVAPLSGRGGWDAFYTVEGQSRAEAAANPGSNLEAVMPNYFSTLGIPILRGRGFTLDDRRRTPPVIAVSRAFAQRAWPGQDPIGKRIKFGSPDGPGPWQRVIAVVGDVRYRDLLAPPPTLYLPLMQTDHQPRWLLVRTRGEEPVSHRALQSAAAEVAPGSMVLSITPLTQLMNGALARPRFLSSLVLVFAALALGLAAVGLYGVMSSIIASRSREIGIRIALGADYGRIRRLVVRQASGISICGIALGLVLALVTTRWLRALLYEVGTLDPLTLLAVTLAILLIAAGASYIPARRATMVDPASALRAE